MISFMTKEEETAIWQDINAIRRDINDVKVTLEEIRMLLAKNEFKTADKLIEHPKPAPVKKQEPTEETQPQVDEADDGIVPDLVTEFGVGCMDDLEVINAPESIKPKRFLQDMWGKYNEYLKTRGYSWITEGKNSRWARGLQSQTAEKTTTPGQTGDAVDVSEIEWKTKVEGETVEARPGEKAWAFAMGYDRDAKKSSDKPKKSTESLVNYLESHEYYCDVDYKYTINEAKSFLHRSPL